ncbi:MAG: hypothetical protein K9J37_16920 [Saprospiraceae bacterium]|nr:hypothetical protein [Saprospiraceae bacterium]MCF8251599.1 hypothetical protein [Saprospiraceae bacterium]MCF8282061.1 hypothetical protein [Bacteroidales bacterium]MCF8313494.1 hypothetical protein [Saprospiraceae bacterium]MCF8442235.1 hypothetical protein [Saprospiraceae bacterium]
MKKHLFAIAFLATTLVMHSTSLSAQPDDNHKYEVGLRFSGINFNGFNSFSAIFKKKLDSGRYRRIGGTFGGLGFANDFDRFSFSFNVGLSIGSEKRKQMGERTSFYSGPVFSLNSGISKTEGIDPNWNLQPGIGVVLGLQYDFNEYWAVNLETIPSGAIALRKFNGSDVAVNANFGFSSNVTLSLMHKF